MEGGGDGMLTVNVEGEELAVFVVNGLDDRDLGLGERRRGAAAVCFLGLETALDDGEKEDETEDEDDAADGRCLSATDCEAVLLSVASSDEPARRSRSSRRRFSFLPVRA